MSGCAIKRGFFILRDCGKPATAVCSVCNRSICQEHLMPDQMQPLCYDCYARQPNYSGAAPSDQEQWQQRHSVYRYRHNFYNSYGYRPYYQGSYYDPYYNDYDPYYDDYDFHSFDHSGWHDHDDRDLYDDRDWHDHDGDFFDS
jgi:hypothetical protein